MNNFQIWQQVSETDPRYVKPGQRGMSSIDGYYFFQLATKTFGPCGIGWGYDILEEEYKNAKPIYNGNGDLMDYTKDHIVKIALWYVMDGQKATIVNYGVTKYAYETKNGLLVDEEAPKKSLTDAIKKCLSMLGFCSDVYMGMFEDRQYVDDVANKKAVEKAIDKDAELARQAKALADDVTKVIDQMGKATTISELEGLYKAIIRKIGSKDKALAIKVTKAKDAAKERLENETV